MMNSLMIALQVLNSFCLVFLCVLIIVMAFRSLYRLTKKLNCLRRQKKSEEKKLRGYFLSIALDIDNDIKKELRRRMIDSAPMENDWKVVRSKMEHTKDKIKD